MADNLEGAICPRCKKEHYPTPEHVYRDNKGAYCSWTCFNHRFDDKNDVRPIEMLNLKAYGKEPTVMRTFNSIAEALCYIDGTPKGLRNALRDGRTYKHFVWRYKKAETENT